MQFLKARVWDEAVVLIGLIADTHNDLDMTNRALALFRERQVELVLHAGDFSSPRIISLFQGFNARFVRGNADIDIEELNERCRCMGQECLCDECEFEVEGRRFLLFHGNDVPRFRAAVASRKYQFIIKGHAHFFENYDSHGVRVINPGSVSGPGERSIAILDTDSEIVEKIILPES